MLNLGSPTGRLCKITPNLCVWIVSFLAVILSVFGSFNKKRFGDREEGNQSRKLENRDHNSRLHRSIRRRRVVDEDDARHAGSTGCSHRSRGGIHWANSREERSKQGTKHSEVTGSSLFQFQQQVIQEVNGDLPSTHRVHSGTLNSCARWSRMTCDL